MWAKCCDKPAGATGLFAAVLIPPGERPPHCRTPLEANYQGASCSPEASCPNTRRLGAHRSTCRANAAPALAGGPGVSASLLTLCGQVEVADFPSAPARNQALVCSLCRGPTCLFLAKTSRPCSTRLGAPHPAMFLFSDCPAAFINKPWEILSRS